MPKSSRTEHTIEGALSQLLFEMEEQRLEVMLAAAPREAFPGQKIRVAQTVNPDWYQELCAANLHGSKTPRRRATTIRRRDITRTLKRLMDGERGFTRYEDFLLEVARDRLEEMNA